MAFGWRNLLCQPGGLTEGSRGLRHPAPVGCRHPRKIARVHDLGEVAEGLASLQDADVWKRFPGVSLVAQPPATFWHRSAMCQTQLNIVSTSGEPGKVHVSKIHVFACARQRLFLVNKKNSNTLEIMKKIASNNLRPNKLLNGTEIRAFHQNQRPSVSSLRRNTIVGCLL